VISGFCRIGERCFFGVNASVADKISIEKDTFVSLGSVINKNSSIPGAILRGNPARVSKISAYRYFNVAQNGMG
jgi:carbonic anhydrase/acetyltransferase-like protein (isoleucine patch superfamily)